MPTREDCVERDRNDPLGAVRDRFVLPKAVNYLDGNSLGARPKGVAERVAKTIEQEWGAGLIRSWNAAGWYEAPGRIGAKLAPLLGAAPHQVIVTDTISVICSSCWSRRRGCGPGARSFSPSAVIFPPTTTSWRASRACWD